MSRIAVVGSREFPKLEWVKRLVAKLDPATDTVVSGGSMGPDRAAVHQAMHCKVGYKVYPAEWDKYGRSAGVIRNELIVKDSDVVVAFWDGKSKGTLNSINWAQKLKLPYVIVYGNGKVDDHSSGWWREKIVDKK